MRTLVSLDTETGVVRRYCEAASMTHEAALTNDPEDAVSTCQVIERFRQMPNPDFRVYTRPGTYESALAKQIMQREREAEKQAQLGPAA